MQKLLAILAVTFGFTMVAVDISEAARVGGGRSSGRQSSSATNSAAPAQKAAPAQQQAAPTPPAPQPSGMSKWMGPLAGLAAGIGIASLLSSMGMGGALGSMIGGILMIVLLLGAGYFIYRLLTRNKSAPQQPLGYAGAGNTGASVPATPSAPATQPAQFTGNAAAAPGSLAATVGGASTLNAAAPASRWPADFDAPEFERQAIMNFNRLQAANDAGDASTLRDFLTPELYRELEAEMKSAWGAPQKTEAVDLKSEVLEVVTEGDLYIVSVRFTGQIRENGVLSNLNEIWHLEKPVSGRAGWRVSGIQQAS